VRAYVRTGRLKAVRVGKQYRIAQEDLDALTGTPAAALPTQSAMHRRHAEIVSIIQIDFIDAEEAARIADLARTTGRAWHTGLKPAQVLSAYDEARKRLKIILSGGMIAVMDALEMIQLLAPSRLPPPRHLRPTRTRS
jgi:isopentenyl diphosphate isomerase/L-lactate dehydrogenase-like FMN-dependent dehydrogenase